MVISVAGPERAVRFIVPGEPLSKARPRVTKRGTYTPKSTLEQEKRVLREWLVLGTTPFLYQVVIDIDFYNATKHRRDIDNMAKLVLDALNKHAFEDDYQVVGLNLRKFFTSKGRERTEVTMKEVIEWPHET